MFELTARRFRDFWSWLRCPPPKALPDLLGRLTRMLQGADAALPAVLRLVGRVEAALRGPAPSVRGWTLESVERVVLGEMAGLLGPRPRRLLVRQPSAASRQPAEVILVLGGEGAESAALAVRLGRKLLGEGRRPLLVSLGPRGAAERDELSGLASRAEVPLLALERNGAEAAFHALTEARRQDRDVLVLEAFPLLTGEEQARALARVTREIWGGEVLLALEARAGARAAEEAARLARSLPLTGAVLSHLDLDLLGGALLSVRTVSGLPVKLAAEGQGGGGRLVRPDPLRLARRLAGLEEEIPEEEEDEGPARERSPLTLELRDASFTLEDWARHFTLMRELGESLPRDLLRLLGSADLLELERRQLMRAQAILSSMTRREREHPEILNSSRRGRIARGSGTSRREVDDLVRDFLLLKRKVARLLRGAGGE